jgi:hypothetical protein
MKTLTLKRITPKKSTYNFGVLLDGDLPFALTCELPWANNQTDVSCIPEGSYICHAFTRGNGQKTFVIQNVPGRASILFHTGNSTRDSEGCIIIGEQFEMVSQPNGPSVPGVLSSKKGFEEFMQRYGKEKQFKLVIKWV